MVHREVSLPTAQRGSNLFLLLPNLVDRLELRLYGLQLPVGRSHNLHSLPGQIEIVFPALVLDRERQVVGAFPIERCELMRVSHRVDLSIYGHGHLRLRLLVRRLLVLRFLIHD